MIIKSGVIASLLICLACLLAACGGDWGGANNTATTSNSAQSSGAGTFYAAAACRNGAPSLSSLSVSAPQATSTTQPFPLLANEALVGASKITIDGNNSDSWCQSTTSYGAGTGGVNFLMGAKQSSVYDGTNVMTRTDDRGNMGHDYGPSWSYLDCDAWHDPRANLVNCRTSGNLVIRFTRKGVSPYFS